MKRILFLSLLLLCLFKSFSQTKGISYQAIILDPNSQNNILSNNDVFLKFIILNDIGVKEYEELHKTSTDKFGMVNLIIGSGEPLNNNFSTILWDGNTKKLKIEIDFNDSGNFIDLSQQNLYYIPQPPNKKTIQLISENSDLIEKEIVRSKVEEEIINTSITELKAENIKQNIEIALNSLKVSYPGDQDISGILKNFEMLNSFKFFYPDKDGDGFGSMWNMVYSPIAPEGYVSNNEDCDDSNSTKHPESTEIVDDGIDQNCDGYDLKTWYADTDGDGYGDQTKKIISNTQPKGYVQTKTDCNDLDASIYPGAPEIDNDGVDQNCDGNK